MLCGILGNEWDLGVGKMGEGRSQRGQHTGRYGEERGEAQVCGVGAGGDSSIWGERCRPGVSRWPLGKVTASWRDDTACLSPQGRLGFPGHHLRDSDRRQVKPHSGQGVHLQSPALPAARVRAATSCHEHVNNKARQKPLPGCGSTELASTHGMLTRLWTHVWH